LANPHPDSQMMRSVNLLELDCKVSSSRADRVSTAL